jgi:hypothetical protein
MLVVPLVPIVRASVVLGSLSCFVAFSVAPAAQPSGPTTTRSFQQGAGQYQSALDTYIHSAQPKVYFGSSERLILDADESQSPDTITAQVLIRFDDLVGSAAHQVPAGAKITSATLTLNRYAGEAGGYSGQNVLAELKKPFTETSLWSDFGGDGIQLDDVEASKTPVAKDVVLSSKQLVGTFDVTESLVRWVENKQPNHGWVLTHRAGQDANFVLLMMHSSDSTESALRPLLQVQFVPPAK